MKIDNARRLDAQGHRSLALWAADCAEHVLSYFEEKYPDDNRPRNAIETGRAWVHGEIAVSEARAAAVAAHAAARDADEAAARVAARAAGHAAATAHMPAHACHAVAYAVKAVAYAVKAVAYAAAPSDDAAATATEHDWQYQRLPEHLQPVVFPDRGND